MDAITISPEVEKLHTEIESLRKDFLRLYTQKDELINVERDDLEVKYTKLIGQQQYENFSLEVEVRALKMKVELAQAALNRGQQPKLLDIEEEVNRQLKQYYDQLRAQAEIIEAAQAAQTVDPYDLTEMHDLFRLLVKRLHPDLHPDLPENMKDLFIQGQTAYRTFNMPLLREIIMRLDIEDDSKDFLHKGEESLQQIRDRLRDKVDSLKNDIDIIESSFPFNMRTNILDEDWVKAQQESRRAEHEQLEALRRKYTDRLSLITDM
ncbi:MAG: hypothetical protein PHC48_03195 [Prevotella sp.]|nr:hypothetical protein [Prevotella sp.]